MGSFTNHVLYEKQAWFALVQMLGYRYFNHIQFATIVVNRR